MFNTIYKYLLKLTIGYDSNPPLSEEELEWLDTIYTTGKSTDSLIPDD